MSLLANAQNTLIQGATFNAIVHGDVHHHSSSQVSLIRRMERGFEMLQHHVAQAAFHDSLERSDPPRCHPLTRRAILERIMHWISDPDSFELFIWIFGPAGGGKSAIAQTIAELCAAVGSLAASFFFSRTVPSRRDFNQLIPTLAYQLALHIPEIREYISRAIERDSTVFSRSLATQMQVLIVQPLNAAANDPLKKEAMENRENVIILDGLDECGDGRTQREVLEVLSAQVKLLEVPILFLITSRPEQQIRNAFSHPKLDSQALAIALDENLNPDDDIRVFLEDKFWEVKRNHPSRSQLLDNWPSEEDIRQIVRKSSGQFIYAATVMKFMDSHRHPPTKRLKIILGAAAPGNNDSPFAELDALYRQLFLAIENLEAAMDLLTLLILQERDSYYLTVDFSENLLAYEQGQVDTLLSDMHAFVHVPKPNDIYDTIRIHHASLPDFLFDRSRSGDFFIDSRNGHANITTHWIKFVQRPPLPDLGARVRTVVRPRGHHSIIITVERIIEHCTKSHLTEELCEALLDFNLEAHLILYPGAAFKELIQSLSSFLQWLKPEMAELSDARWELYHYHMTHIDRWILNQLSLFPDEMRSNLSVAFIFEDKFSSSPGALFDILSHKFDPSTNSFSKIGYSTANKDFWFICQEFGGTLLFDIFKGFFTDPSRSGAYVVHDRSYAELACIFLSHIRLAPESKDFAEPWSHHRYHYVPNGNRYRMERTEGTDEVLIRAALEFLPSVLSRSPENADLVQSLKEHALQLKSTDPFHHKRLDVAIAGFEYLKKVESSFEEHVHKPDYNICIICLLQPGAIHLPAPPSSSSLDQAVDPAQANAVPITSPPNRELRLRWNPPVQESSEVEELVTPNWMFEDFQQMVEEAELPQPVEGADLLRQVVRRTTVRHTVETVTLTEVYSKWAPNSRGSTSRAVGRRRRAPVAVATEPTTPIEAHSMLPPAMQDGSETGTPIGSSSLLNPKGKGKVTADSVVSFNTPHPPQNGTASRLFSRSPSPRTVDSKNIAAEPTSPFEPWALALRDDSKSQIDEGATFDTFSSASSAQVNPKGKAKAAPDAVFPTNPPAPMQNEIVTGKTVFSPRRVVPAEPPIILAGPQLDNTATPNFAFPASSSLLDPKGAAEITVEPLLTSPELQLHKIASRTPNHNSFSTFSKSSLLPNGMVDVVVEPLPLAKPHLHKTGTRTPNSDAFSTSSASPLLPNGVADITVKRVTFADPPAKFAFSTASKSSFLDPNGVVEFTDAPKALKEPHPKLIPGTHDEMETRDDASATFSPPHETVDVDSSPPERVAEPATEPIHCVLDDDLPPTATPKPILPTLQDSLPNIRLARTSTLLLGLVIVTVTLATLHQNWARTSHL